MIIEINTETSYTPCTCGAPDEQLVFDFGLGMSATISEFNDEFDSHCSSSKVSTDLAGYSEFKEKKL